VGKQGILGKMGMGARCSDASEGESINDKMTAQSLWRNKTKQRDGENDVREEE
jgi:hypothetical protein